MARGNIATLTAAIDELYEGEVVYGLDTQALYCKDGNTLVGVAGESVVSVNGQTGVVVLNVEDLNDVGGTPVQGDTLVYNGTAFEFVQAQGVGTVTSIDIEGSNGIEATGGPITAAGVINVSLDNTGVVAGEYVTPTVTVNDQGRITAIEAGTLPPLALNDLTDIDAPAPGIGDGIVWNGTSWVNSPEVGGGGSSDVQSLEDLSDVEFPGIPGDGQALVYDGTTGLWSPGDVDSGGSASTLGELLDVTIDSPGNRQIIQYDPASGGWKNANPSLPSIGLIDNVTQLPDTANGDVLMWDSYSSQWISGPLGSKGPLTLETKNFIASESPLVGGNGNSADDQALIDLGFTLYTGNGTFDDTIFLHLDLQGLNCAAHGAQLYRGLTTESGDFDTFVNADGMSMMSAFTVLTLNNPGDSTKYQPGYYFADPGNFDYESNSTQNAQVEFSVFTEAGSDFSMEIVRAGVLPRYTFEGQDWTIWRVEMVSFFNPGRRFAREIWISENGDIYVKQGQPSWSFNWPVQQEDSQGIYTRNYRGKAPAGWGDGDWANQPFRGSYIAYIGGIEQLPPDVITTFDGLDDTNFDGLANGDIAQYDGTEWVNIPFPAPDLSNSSLDDLSDVDTTTDAPGAYDALVWNGNAWVPGTPAGGGTDIGDSSIGDLSDVDTTTDAPEIGQLLQWDGSNWVPVDAPVTGATELNDLTDVNVATPAPEDTQVLAYSQSDDEWQAANPRATAGAPTETNFPGLPGEMRYSADHFYICIAPNTWKQVALSTIGGGPEPEPEIGDIADGGNFLDGTPGTIDTILDGGNWTTGASGDQQDVTMDGGYFTPEPTPEPELPGPDDSIDGGDFIDGTPGTNAFLMDGGNFTTGEAGSADITLDGGLFTGGLPGADDTIDGGDFTDGTPGTNFRVDGGDFTTGAAGTANQVLDGGNFTGSVALPGPDDTINGGDFTTGSGGTDFQVDGGNFTTGAAGTGGIQDGGYFSSIVNPANGGNFTTGLGGDLREIVDGGNFTLGWVIDDSPADGGDFSTSEEGSENEILDGGDFSA